MLLELNVLLCLKSTSLKQLKKSTNAAQKITAKLSIYTGKRNNWNSTFNLKKKKTFSLLGNLCKKCMHFTIFLTDKSAENLDKLTLSLNKQIP